MRVAIISNNATSLSNFRGELIRELVSRGSQVYALAPDYTCLSKSVVERLGAIPITYSMSRTGMNPITDILDFWRLVRYLTKLHADLSLAYFIKPVIYGTIAARFAGVPKRFAMIEGLGYVFTDVDRPSLKRRVLRVFVTWLYKFSLRSASGVFVLNQDDEDLFVNEKTVTPEKLIRLDGIGVNLNHFQMCPPVNQPLCFIFIGRFLCEKGIYEFMQAAEEVHEQYPSVRFVALGGVDPNPGSMSQAELDEWAAKGTVTCPGNVDDVRPWLSRASVFVLPSYREGLPRSTQEAMAMGRAVITTDVPGCRETVIEGVNGFVVPVRNVRALVAAMLKFVEHPELVGCMGTKSRAIAEKRFDARIINAQIIKSLNIGV